MIKPLLQVRPAGLDDAAAVARLHAESWRRHYRGAYADAFLDGDVLADRLAVWSARLASPEGTLTLIADDDVGFVHVVFNHDKLWGSLVDNLHVVPQRQRAGVGKALMTHVASALGKRPLYLWVLEQNLAAQAFYRALGGAIVEKAKVPPIGGVPGRLNGAPNCLRVAWPDASSIARALS
ncbi:MAG TPA: GNAT family N-acetyltransferase [Candidatus Limnocylindrales bacterium]|nr:GNAT family N-acetyltransferase [Candidatus Limnocylindrales bacterium]